MRRRDRRETRCPVMLIVSRGAQVLKGRGYGPEQRKHARMNAARQAQDLAQSRGLTVRQEGADRWCVVNQAGVTIYEVCLRQRKSGY